MDAETNEIYLRLAKTLRGMGITLPYVVLKRAAIATKNKQTCKELTIISQLFSLDLSE